MTLSAGGTGPVHKNEFIVACGGSSALIDNAERERERERESTAISVRPAGRPARQRGPEG